MNHRNKTNKKIGIILISILAVVGLSAVVYNNSMSKSNSAKKIITTTPIVTKLTKEIVKDNIQVESIVPTNKSIHSYELTVEDIKKIDQNAFFTLGELESASIKKIAANKKIDLSTNLRLLESNHNHEEHSEHNHEEHANEEKEYDVHFFMSPNRVSELIDNIEMQANKLIDNSDKKLSISKNAQNLKERIQAISKNYAQSDIFKSTKLVAHDNLQYLKEDYNLNYVPINDVYQNAENSIDKTKKTQDFISENQVKVIIVDEEIKSNINEIITQNNLNSKKLNTLELNDNKTIEEVYIENLAILKDN